ncbi:hypothetical protein K501DRAFT_324701 [Backusella circina FSU 941]|nr:hypothetical protein K501DRAFT_324701 [Backusella circina FSU 941]
MLKLRAIETPALPTIKCSQCSIYIDVRRLDDHRCVPIEPTLKDISSVTSENNGDIFPPLSNSAQRRSRERSNGFSSMRRIIQKIKDGRNSTETNLNKHPSISHHNPMHSELDRSSSLSVRAKNSTCPAPGIVEDDDLESSLTHVKDGSKIGCYICKMDMPSDEIIEDTEGYTYHASCIYCKLCRAPLGANNFLRYNDKIYCKRDYQVVKNRAQTEPSPIKNSYKIPNETCSHCKILIDVNDKDSYKIYRDELYCKKDFAALFLPKCRSCYQPVEKEAISAMDGKLDGKWHISCFCCQICKIRFPDNTFYVYGNLPYCKQHYHYLNNTLCRMCHDPIEGPCAHTSEGWRFHPDCFTCEVCQNKLVDNYYVFEGRIYCDAHINRRNIKKSDKRLTQIFDL